MSTPLQLRRDSAMDLTTATLAEAEPGYDQTNSRLIVGDGLQVGGIPHASYRDVQAQSFSYGEATPVGNEYRLDLSPPLIAYEDGVTIVVNPTRDSEGPATLNVNGLGAVPVRKIVGVSLADTEAGDLQAGQVFQATYVNGFFQLLSREPLLPQPPEKVELITSGSLVGVGSVDIRSIPQDYSMLSLFADSVRHGRNAGESFTVRASSNNGSSFDTQGNFGNGGFNTGDLVSSGRFSEGVSLRINVTITGYQRGPYAHATWVNVFSTGGLPAGHGSRFSVSEINALRLRTGSGAGAWSSGGFALYGIR